MSRHDKRTNWLPAAFIALSFVLSVHPTACVKAARILGFFASPSKSHIIVHCSVADALAQAGHDVTVIASGPNVRQQAKYKYIELEIIGDHPLMSSDIVDKRQPFWRRFGSFLAAINRNANETYHNPRVQQFLRQHHAGDFDLLLFGYFMNDFQLGLAGHFRCPIVVSFMIQPIYAVNKFVGNPSETAYVPGIFGYLVQPMKFLERVKNMIVAMIEEIVIQTMQDYQGSKYYNYNFPSDRYPPLDEVRKNVSLIFTNHHFSQGPIRPNVPNLIEIGGIQIKEKPDPLPTDIAKVLDESKEGVIYFSLGSNIKGSHLNEEKIKIMFNVISKLPYKVLWKWSPTELPGESKNIIFRDWLPQDDILAHPNIKLFITHGGMGSVVESQYHGVPMVGIPLFGDQPSNMVNVERSGYGLAVDYLTLTEESLNNAIQDVLNNPKYKEAVQTFSRLYRDRPMTPRETVVYWVDYVLRHKGAKHMQSPAVHMNRWQLLSLDVIGFLLAIVLTISVVIVKVCKLICCRGRKNKLPKVEKAKQN
ncbi:UDP-glycosyltransferase UGT5-like isoform X1 [Bactrocera neohumeralis]|uniref:UDP-glycosyltransferase UGT5-like isoform X1 n=1 Tax=Bactrocera neohumeralis TaxID=98809 RepID=UPI0021662450|nr:UDP-glycosyltransferase UGT5-like isoform X1 [Bactrocera neohumeralis]